MRAYFNKWTVQRIIQLTIGSYFIWNSIEIESKLSLAFGVIMSFQSIFNVGCFSSKGCSTTTEEEAQPFAKNINKIN